MNAEFENLIQSVFDGTATDEEVQSLHQQLEKSEEARDFYLREVELHTQLQMLNHRSQSASGDAPASFALEYADAVANSLDRSVPVFLLKEGTQIVGRSVDCEICLLDSSISRRHARLEVSGTMVKVHDLSSHNGVFVDGQKVSDAEVRIGQEVSFGTARFRLISGKSSLIAGHDEADPGSKVAQLPPLSRRLLELLIQGLNESEIARNMNLGEHSLHNRIKSLYAALGVDSRDELVSLYSRAT